MPDYIVWSAVDWHVRHHRSQCLALALAASGRRVFYVSASLIDDEHVGIESEPLDSLDSTGCLFQIKLFVKDATVMYSSTPGVEAVSHLRASIGEVLDWADSTQVVSLIHHPFWRDIATVLPNCRVIYNCTDLHEAFADLAVTTSAQPDQTPAELAHHVDALIAQAESMENDQKVSIVVVTYNNLSFTRACLGSLDEHSNYGQLEIIVVDNASTDGTQEFLSHWIKAASNRKIILNEKNLGFAAANNRGLAAANGEYLVILNNDTYVTPGWVRTLVKHLQRDESLGLIGPVTNNIGNEAKIDITYASMDKMLRFCPIYSPPPWTNHPAGHCCLFLRNNAARHIHAYRSTG